MRADRLLSMMLLLQARGRMTARALAAELEVTERTILRDVTALSTAGVPVYCERGPGGGISLVDSYRSDLTGLTADEIRALFMVNIPKPLEELGLAGPLKAALLKISSAFPDASTSGAAQARQRFFLDSTPWSTLEVPLTFLALLQQAAWQDRCLRLTRMGYFQNTYNLAEVEPYGLVAKAGEWMLVGKIQAQLYVLRVSDMLEVEILEKKFQRSPDFDLASFWQNWLEENRAHQSSYPVRARCASALIPILRRYFERSLGLGLSLAAPPDAQGWFTIVLPFRDFFQARRRILSWGRDIEVLQPEALRYSVLDFANQIKTFYEEIEIMN